MYNHIFLIRWIKKRIPFKLKIFLIRLIILYENFIYVVLHIKEKEFTKEKKIFVLLSTDYSNLGDHAMTYAQEEFLHKNFPDYQVIEILVGDTMKYLYSIRQSLSKDDVITLKGGGNVGVEYFREELIRRKIIKYFPNNKIIMFPQTVYFPDTKFGRKEFDKTVKVFNSNPLFFAFLRDKISYDMIAPRLKNVFLTPDIVLSLDSIPINHYMKKGALTCLRRDVEGIYSDDNKNTVYSVLKNNYDEVICTDTIRDYKIESKDRLKELKDIWTQIANAEILVTDRLHGMIFAALLGTPCIVLNTYNYKLKAQYEWLKDLNYIKMIELSEENLQKTITQLKTTSIEVLDNKKYELLFNQIKKVIENKNEV